MKEQFCTYEISLKLKELGFDEECLAIYANNEKDHLFFLGGTQIIEFNYSLKVPLWQQTIDWFRKKYGYYINIHQIFYNKNEKIAYFFSIEGNKCGEMIYDYQDRYGAVLDSSEQDVPGNYINDDLYNKNLFDMRFAYKTYEEAREQAILKAIEIVKK